MGLRRPEGTAILGPRTARVNCAKCVSPCGFPACRSFDARWRFAPNTAVRPRQRREYQFRVASGRMSFHSRACTSACQLSERNRSPPSDGKVRGQPDFVTVLGNLTSVTAGEHLEASGRWVIDREHGRQFRAEQLRTTHPATAEGIERYLASGFLDPLVGTSRSGLVVAAERRGCITFCQESRPDAG